MMAMKEKFSSNIGILRIVAMGMIVCEHVFSGIYGQTQFPDVNKYIFLFLMTLLCYGVD